MIYDLDYDRATEVCASHSNPHFHYYCAFGVYMTLIRDTPNNFTINSLEPCDTVKRFPASCFDFKGRTATLLKDFTGICNHLSSPYHEDGCVFGMAEASLYLSPEDVTTYCGDNYSENERHYLLCVDGFLNTHKILRSPAIEQQHICDSLLYESAREICYRKHTKPLQQMRPEEAKAFNSTYEYEILESNYDPFEQAQAIIWNSEWDKDL